MSIKGWQGRQAILTMPNTGTDSDILDLGAQQTVKQTGVVGAASTTTSIVTASLVGPVLSSVAVLPTLDQYKGLSVLFRPDTTTANLRNQQRLISANTILGVITVAALSDAPAAGDVFDIVELEEAKSYRRWDIQVLAPAAVTGTVSPMVSNTSVDPGNFVILQSGAANIVIPAARATPIIPMIARFLKFNGTAQGQYTHILVMGSTINIQ